MCSSLIPFSRSRPIVFYLVVSFTMAFFFTVASSRRIYLLNDPSVMSNYILVFYDELSSSLSLSFWVLMLSLLKYHPDGCSFRGMLSRGFTLSKSFTSTSSLPFVSTSFDSSQFSSLLLVAEDTARLYRLFAVVFIRFCFESFDLRTYSVMRFILGDIVDSKSSFILLSCTSSTFKLLL